MDYPENKIYSWKTVAVTFPSTYLIAVILLWILVWPQMESPAQAFAFFPTLLFYFPMGLKYYFDDTMGGWEVLFFFYFVYLALFVSALNFRRKKVFFIILAIWIILLILNVHGCMNTDNSIS